mmetsp:Transcript_7294/g.12245  ORF Transcript_7294/g.12245 Transcript_7294/m.12245 type:complete len:593 (-) Transcript_7294:248-2026(-)
MGSSASVLDETAKKEDITAEDMERKQQIVSNKERLSVDDIKDLCQIEEHQDPSKHLFYIQIFNTLKEWDHKGGVDVQKLAFITEDICEREVLQLFLTFCDGKMDSVQFLEFTKRTKLFCKSRLTAPSVNEIFDRYSFTVDGSNDVRYINYIAFRFKIIPDICEKKNEDVSRVINKLCWIDYSHVTPSPAVSKVQSRPDIESDSAVESASDDARTRAVTNIQRIQRGRHAKKVADHERELISQHNLPLTSRVMQQVAAQEEGGPLALLSPPRAEGNDDDNHSTGLAEGTFSPNSNKTALTPSSKTPKMKTPMQRDYTDFDIKKATSREFSLQTTKDSLRSPLFKKDSEVGLPQVHGDVEEPPATQVNPVSLQTNLAHIIGEYHHRLEYTPRKDGPRSARVKVAPAPTPKQKPLIITPDPISPPPHLSGDGPVPLEMPDIDGEAGSAIHQTFTKFAPSGEMTVNDFVRFCYATVLIPFEPPIDFTGTQARFVFRQVIAECFNPEANTYVKGIMFGKRIEFEIFWTFLIPAIAKIKRQSNSSIVDFLYHHVSHAQLRRLYSSEEGPALISLLSTQKDMDSDCSSFKGIGAHIEGH